MEKQARAVTGVLAGLCLFLGPGAAGSSQVQPAVPGAIHKEAVMTTRASGNFDVKMTPQAADDKAEVPVGRMSIDKQYHGDLEGTGKGEMLYAGGPAKGSGGYVAIERVSGTLQGRSGTFVLQHSGTMTRGGTQMTITVVPDSGTGQLAGLSGSLNIKIDNGQHSYEFEYALPGTP